MPNSYLLSFLCQHMNWLLISNTVEAHNSGQVGHQEIVPYCGIFPYFASSLFTNGHFGHSGFVPYFASFPYFAVPYCERLLYSVLCEFLWLSRLWCCPCSHLEGDHLLWVWLVKNSFRHAEILWRDVLYHYF